MEFKFSKLEYELIKKYRSMGYRYISINFHGNIVFSKYPINELKPTEVCMDINLFKDFQTAKDYGLDELLENIISVK